MSPYTTPRAARERVKMYRLLCCCWDGSMRRAGKVAQAGPRLGDDRGPPAAGVSTPDPVSGPGLHETIGREGQANQRGPGTSPRPPEAPRRPPIEVTAVR